MRLGSNLAVHPGQDTVKILHDGDFRSQPVPDRSELQADIARADDHETFGHLLVGQSFSAAANPISVKFDSPQPGHLAPGRDDDSADFEQLGLLYRATLNRFQTHPPGGDDSTVAVIASNIVLFEK